MDDNIFLDINITDSNKTETYTYSLIDDYLSYELYQDGNLEDIQNLHITDNLNNNVVKKFYKVFDELIEK